MDGYDFPGQIAASDASEGNGVMGSGMDSTRVEMSALLEVLIGAKVTENLVVMVDNQSILREISR